MKKKKKILQELRIALPQTWGELTPEQVARVAYYINQGGDETEFLVRLGIEFSGLQANGTGVLSNGDIGYVYFRRGEGNIMLSAEQMAAIAQAMKWTIGDPEPMAAPPVPGYITPDDELHGITVKRYVIIDTACGLYLKSREPRFLRIMVAALYPRRRYDHDGVAAQADRMDYLPAYRFEAVLLWYVGVKKLLKQKYPYVFTDGEGEASDPDAEKLQMMIVSALNGGRVTENETIKEIDINEALYELNSKIEAAQKVKARK